MTVSKKLLLLTRTLHIYISTLALLLVLFFSVTGFMMNHSEWFAHDQSFPADSEFNVSTSLLADNQRNGLINDLRLNHGVTGKMETNELIDNDPDQFIHLVFKSPHGSYDAMVNQKSGNTQLHFDRKNLAGYLAALHMGTDTGRQWKLVIDGTAIFLAFISLTGLILWISLSKRRKIGYITLAVCIVACAGVFYWTVP